MVVTKVDTTVGTSYYYSESGLNVIKNYKPHQSNMIFGTQYPATCVITQLNND